MTKDKNSSQTKTSSQKQDMLTRPVIVFLLALLACTLWGSAFPSIKIGYRLFDIASTDTSSQILFAGCRFTLAGILTIIIGSSAEKKLLIPKKESWLMVFILCLFQTVLQYTFFYLGLARTSGVKASIFDATVTFWSILLACLVFRQEKLTPRKMIGCVVGFAGILVVNLIGTGDLGTFVPTGDGFILIAAVSSAMSSVLITSFSKRENPVALSGWQFVVGGLILTALGLILGGKLEPSSWKAMLMLLYLGFLSAAAYSIWSLLLSKNPVSTVSIYGFINPVAGVFLSAIFLGETNQAFSLAGLLALILVFLGIYIVNHRQSASDES